MRRDKLFFLLFILHAYVPVLAQVDTAWVRFHGGGGSNGLAVDKNGNVYVTGTDTCGVAYYDIATIKLTPSGDTSWVKCYTGPGTEVDIGHALTVDDNGNVYVAGEVTSTSGFADFGTIKYAADGETLWVRLYDGPGQGGGTESIDIPSDIEVDESGNVYVTGGSIGTGTNFDYATIKYNSNGDTVWVRRYNGPGNGEDKPSEIEVDGSGNVFVTGYAFDNVTSYDYTTIKYASNGNILWVRIFNGSQNLSDIARGLAMDANGNVYVTGQTKVGSGLNDYDYATIKYDPNGDTLWVRRYNGPDNNEDIARDIFVDGDGNVYVTGESWDIQSSIDYATIKYDSNGDSIWVRRYNGPGNDGDAAAALEVDSDGNVYVTGRSRATPQAGSNDFATIKYDSSGNTLWVVRYNGPNDLDDEPSAMVIDTNGNIYVTGRSGFFDQDSSYQFQGITVKYFPVINTPVGSDVSVQPKDSLTITFDSVSEAGYTSVNTDSNGPEPPSGFQIVPSNPPIYYDILTSATYVDSLTLCFDYSEQAVEDEDSLALFHRVEVSPDSFEWQDVTISMDTFANQICGRIVSLSQFVLAEPLSCLAKSGDVNGDGSYSLPDIIGEVNIVFKGAPKPTPACRTDANADNGTSLPDIIILVNKVFKGGPAPPPIGVCCL